MQESYYQAKPGESKPQGVSSHHDQTHNGKFFFVSCPFTTFQSPRILSLGLVEQLKCFPQVPGSCEYRLDKTRTCLYRRSAISGECQDQ
jgi:hypothetical protein